MKIGIFILYSTFTLTSDIFMLCQLGASFINYVAWAFPVVVWPADLSGSEDGICTLPQDDWQLR